MSRPGNRASKSPSTGEPTQSPPVEGHGSDRKRVDAGRLLSPGSKSSACSEQPSLRESGDLEGASPRQTASADGNAKSDNPSVQVFEESDEVIVPEKSAKTWVTPVESMEGRTEAKGKSAARNAPRTQGRTNDAPTDMQRIGQRAKIDALTSVDPRWEPSAGNPLAGLCPGGGPKGPSLPGQVGPG